tara:strand:+ start:27 stop:632 length:606 start_codon:yes stop_codon:yes gene_type:complete
MIVANHPTGLADGVAIWDLLRKVRHDVIFFANADALRVNPNMLDVIIPIEWLPGKRTHKKTRDVLKKVAQAAMDEKCLVIFPSGVPARTSLFRAKEAPWLTSFISLSRRHNIRILPVHISASNSKLYSLLSWLGREFRNIALFQELLNKQKAIFKITIGNIVDPDELIGDPDEIGSKFQTHVLEFVPIDSGAPWMTIHTKK